MFFYVTTRALTKISKKWNLTGNRLIFICFLDHTVANKKFFNKKRLKICEK